MKERQPNIENILKVLKGDIPERPTLFEIYLNRPLKQYLSGKQYSDETDVLTKTRITMDAFAAAGYDYVTLQAGNFQFYPDEINRNRGKSFSLNDTAVITNWEEFEQFKWPDPIACDDGRLKKIEDWLPDGMKVMAVGPSGILETMEQLIGYDNLCMLLYDDPALVKSVADKIGSLQYRYYETALQYDSVAFACITDDWGFNTQTLFSPDMLREYVFPWHKRIAELSHRFHKPIILHSCGYFENIIDDIVNDMKFDGRHSYEDNILPVEDAYDKYGDRIAILGGIDVDFLCRATPEAITRRCRKMIEKSLDKGRYALGSGSSVPDYVPVEKYMAMINTVREYEL